jgi:MscS family membrane protein
MTMRIVALVLALVAAAAPLRADTTTAAGGVTTSTTRPEDADLGFTSPQSTMRGFLDAAGREDWDRAADHLDLRQIPRADRDAAGPELARQLRDVLERTLAIDVDSLSDTPEGERDDGLPARRDLVGTIRTPTGGVDVLVERATLPEGGLGWKIAATTVAAIPGLYARFGPGPFAEWLPKPLVTIQLLQVRLWQWIGLVVLVCGGVLLAWLATGAIVRAVGFGVERLHEERTGGFLGVLVGPLRLAVVLFVFTAGVPLLALSVPAAHATAIVRKTTAIVAFTWFLLRFVDVLAALAADRMGRHGRGAAVSVVPLGRRSLKVFVAAIAAIAIVQNLGYDATGILAGLGVGGLALALAAQKTVENLFGGATLIVDQPVRVGDVCRFDSRIGTVEDIGLRSTRIRTPERTVVSVPNGSFAAMEIENLSRRDRLLLKTTLTLKPDTPADQVRTVLAKLTDALTNAAKIDHNSVSVHFSNITAAALELETSAYVLTRDWTEFVKTRETVLLQFLEILEQAGAPTK